MAGYWEAFWKQGRGRRARALQEDEKSGGYDDRDANPIIESPWKPLIFLVLRMLPRMIDSFCKNTVGGVSKTGFTLSVMQIVVLAACLMGFAREGTT